MDLFGEEGCFFFRFFCKLCVSLIIVKLFLYMLCGWGVCDCGIVFGLVFWYGCGVIVFFWIVEVVIDVVLFILIVFRFFWDFNNWVFFWYFFCRFKINNSCLVFKLFKVIVCLFFFLCFFKCFFLILLFLDEL